MSRHGFVRSLLAISGAALISSSALAGGMSNAAHPQAPAGGAGGPAGAGGAAAMAGAPDKPYGDWHKLTGGADTQKGFFTLYKKRESLYL